MTIQEAIDIVYELACQNIIDKNEMPEEHERQQIACNVVHDFVLNNIHN